MASTVIGAGITIEGEITTDEDVDAVLRAVAGVTGAAMPEPATGAADIGLPAAQRRTWGAGLMITALPAASAAKTLPAGIAMGKFHGGATTVSRTGSKRASATSASERALSA